MEWQFTDESMSFLAHIKVTVMGLIHFSPMNILYATASSGTAQRPQVPVKSSLLTLNENTQVEKYGSRPTKGLV